MTKKVKSQAMQEIMRLAQAGLVTIIFDKESGKAGSGNVLKLRLLEFDEKGNYVDQTGSSNAKPN